MTGVGGPRELDRVMIRRLGGIAFATGAAPMVCPESTAWRRQAWIEGWVGGLVSCAAANPAKCLPLFPVKPRPRAAWGDLEDRIVAEAWHRQVPAKRLAPWLGRTCASLYERARMLAAVRRRRRPDESAAA